MGFCLHLLCFEQWNLALLHQQILRRGYHSRGNGAHGAVKTFLFLTCKQSHEYFVVDVVLKVEYQG